jgi:hypothetical protein
MVKDGYLSSVAFTATMGIGSIDLPSASGDSALGCTGDLESTFFAESFGELPMVDFGSRVAGVRALCSQQSWLTQNDDVLRSAGVTATGNAPAI